MKTKCTATLVWAIRKRFPNEPDRHGTHTCSLFLESDSASPHFHVCECNLFWDDSMVLDQGVWRWIKPSGPGTVIGPAR